MNSYTVVGTAYDNANYVNVRPQVWGVDAENETYAIIQAFYDPSFDPLFLYGGRDTFLEGCSIKAVEEPPDHTCAYLAEVYNGEDCSLCDDFDRRLRVAIAEVD